MQQCNKSIIIQHSRNAQIKLKQRAADVAGFLYGAQTEINQRKVDHVAVRQTHEVAEVVRYVLKLQSKFTGSLRFQPGGNLCVIKTEQKCGSSYRIVLLIQHPKE
ncbi:Hypothetical_protein [Hexamita inflata]|uniref:Hypothetical_protein n=1 Tax=Hexamita inflata TaxID=28002 RepID=A0ABP1HLC6_9EUKA